MSRNKTAEQLRGPKCSRCGYHGIIVRTKGHRNKCPFLQCRCWKCELLRQRSRIVAVQKRIDDQSRRRRPDPHMDLDLARGAGDPPAQAAGSGATGDCCPLDLRTRPPAAAGCQVHPGRQIPNPIKFGPRIPVATLPHAHPLIPAVFTHPVAPPPPTPQAGPDGPEA